MKGGYTDNYYMQMAQNIRRYKGVRPIPELQRTAHDDASTAIFADWAGVDSRVPRHGRATRSTATTRATAVCITERFRPQRHRHLQSRRGRRPVYFYAETIAPLTPHTGNNWMLLLIDADQNHDTGWYGYDYLVNKKVVDGNTTTLMRYDPRPPTIPGSKQAQVPYRYAGKSLELAMPRQLLGLTGRRHEFRFPLVRQSGGLERPDFAVRQRRQCPEPTVQLPLYLDAALKGKSVGNRRLLVSPCTTAACATQSVRIFREGSPLVLMPGVVSHGYSVNSHWGICEKSAKSGALIISGECGDYSSGARAVRWPRGEALRRVVRGGRAGSGR